MKCMKNHRNHEIQSNIGNTEVSSFTGFRRVAADREAPEPGTPCSDMSRDIATTLQCTADHVNRRLKPKTRCVTLTAFVDNRAPSASLPDITCFLLFLKLFVL